MLKKANQKRLLDNVVIQQGDFTTEFFGRMDWRDMLDDDMAKAREPSQDRIVDIDVEPEAAIVTGEEREMAQALAAVEDEEDAAAARIAQGEGELDVVEFGAEGETAKKVNHSVEEQAVTPMDVDEADEVDDDDEPGAIDEYMLKMVSWDWEWFSTF